MFDTATPMIGDVPDYGHPLLRGLAGWWPMFERGGTTVFDYSRFGNDRSFTNFVGSSRTIGDLGQAVTCDATNDRIDLGTHYFNSGHWTSGKQMTICCWLKKASAPGAIKSIVAKWDNPYSFWFAVAASGAPILYLYDGGTRGPATGSVNCCDGNWNFVHATYDGSTIRVGTNVAGFGTSAYSGTIGASASQMSLNSRSIDTAYVLGADYADLRVYARCLSDSELRAIYCDPWALLKHRRTPYLSVAGGGGGSIAAHVMHYRRMMTG